MASRRVIIFAAIAAFVAIAIVVAMAVGATEEERVRVEVVDRSGAVVGWAYEDELRPPLPSLAELQPDFDIGQRVAVYGSNGTLVGHMVTGTGFIPLERPPG